MGVSAPRGDDPGLIATALHVGIEELYRDTPAAVA